MGVLFLPHYLIYKQRAMPLDKKDIAKTLLAFAALLLLKMLEVYGTH